MLSKVKTISCMSVCGCELFTLTDLEVLTHLSKVQFFVHSFVVGVTLLFGIATIKVPVLVSIISMCMLYCSCKTQWKLKLVDIRK